MLLCFLPACPSSSLSLAPPAPGGHGALPHRQLSIRAPSPAAYPPPPLHSARRSPLADLPLPCCLPSSALGADGRERSGAGGAAEAGRAAQVGRMAMGGAEQHAAAGERSSAGGPSGARGRLVAVGYVSVREFLASLFRDTRTRRGYVSRPYPRRIRVGYVSDTGYAPSLPYPCF